MDVLGGKKKELKNNIEFATLEWIDRFNHRRLLEPIGDKPPAEMEAEYHGQESGEIIELPKQPSLR